MHDITGVYPGMWKGDFLHLSNDIANRQTMIDMAKPQWASGALVGLMWHSCPPTMAEPCSWTDVQSKLTSQQWSDNVHPNTAMNNAWKAKLDRIVPYLEKLQKAGFPVLWRPLHEMNDGWSWWGGNANSALLFQVTHQYLKLPTVEVSTSFTDHTDTRLLKPFSEVYSGGQYVGVVALDPWNSVSALTNWYNTLQGIALGKPIALTEVSTLPTPAQLMAQPKWACLSCWAEYLTRSNSDGAVKATYYSPLVLHRGDIHL